MSSVGASDMTEAVGKFRSILRYVETSSTKPLRQVLARQLAELLLRVVCNGKYQKFIVSAERDLVRFIARTMFMSLLPNILIYFPTFHWFTDF